MFGQPWAFESPSQLMLNVVGKLLEASAWLVRSIAFDAHFSHSWFREAIMGHLETIKSEVLERVPFFRHLKHRDLPKHVLPHLPLKLCEYNELPFAAVPGICFSEFGLRLHFSSAGFCHFHLRLQFSRKDLHGFTWFYYILLVISFQIFGIPWNMFQ